VAAATPPSDPLLPAPGAAFVLTHVTVIDGTGRLPRADQTVAVDRGRLTYVGPASGRPLQPGEATIDGSQKYLLPGFIDAHAHVTYLDWPPEGSVGALATINDEVTRASLRLLLDFGVTAVRNPGGPTAPAVSYRDRISSGALEGPLIRTAGEVLNRATRFDGLTRPVLTEADVEHQVDAEARAGVDFIKVYSGMPPALIGAAIRAAHARHLKVIGHLQTTSWGEAARMGIDGICHGASWSAGELAPEHRDAYRRAIKSKGTMRARMDWLDWVDPSGVEMQRTIRELAERRIPVDPTLIAYATKFEGRDPRFLASPDLALAPAAMRTSFFSGTFVEDWTSSDFERGQRVWPKMQALVRSYQRGGVVLMVGSDEPNAWIVPGPSLHTEMELLVEAGLSPLSVLTMATRNGAEGLGLLSELGTIETGKRADLVLLSRDPTADIRNTRSIVLVVSNGRIVRNHPPR
jgi:imidazolonepropionase-like amidohydrolase